jgi:hypothetical protein
MQILYTWVKSEVDEDLIMMLNGTDMICTKAWDWGKNNKPKGVSHPGLNHVPPEYKSDFRRYNNP